MIFWIFPLIAAMILSFNNIFPKPYTKNINIRVVFKNSHKMSEFWQDVSAGIDAAAREFGVNVRVTGTNSENDDKGQIKVLKEAVASRPDAIILASSDYNALVPSVVDAERKGIKVILIDSDINSKAADSCIATDNVELGAKAGKELNKVINTRTKVAIISCTKETRTVFEREKGVRQSFDKNSSKRILETYFCDEDEDIAYQITSNLIKNQRDLGAIIGLDSISTLGAARALHDFGMNEKIKLIGLDSSPQEIGFIESGELQAIVVQRPFNMGYLGVKAAVLSVKGFTVAKRMDIDSVVVNRNNLYSEENQKLLFTFAEN
jgi:ribose transport system substrate-binding protein